MEVRACGAGEHSVISYETRGYHRTTYQPRHIVQVARCMRCAAVAAGASRVATRCATNVTNGTNVTNETNDTFLLLRTSSFPVESEPDRTTRTERLECRLYYIRLGTLWPVLVAPSGGGAGLGLGRIGRATSVERLLRA